jgi:hypothetical protein
MKDQPTHIKKLAQAASNYAVPAPEKAWGRINRKIKQKNKKLNTHGVEIHTIILISLIALVTVVGVYYQIDKHRNLPQVEHQQKKVEELNTNG